MNSGAFEDSAISGPMLNDFPNFTDQDESVRLIGIRASVATERQCFRETLVNQQYGSLQRLLQ